jgi:hypothetical protein
MPTFRRSATLEARDGTVPELPEDFMARVRGINLVQSNALPTRNPTPAVDQSMGRRLRGRLVVRRGFPNSYTGCPLVESAIGDIPAGLASFVIVHCNGPMSSFGDDDENSAEHRLKGCQSSYRRQLLNDTVISGNEHDA